VSSASGRQVSGQFQCPEKTGYFPDPEQCDLYYKCKQGQPEEKLCPDGLVFDDSNPSQARCDIPANVDCGDRTELREWNSIRKGFVARNLAHTVSTGGTVHYPAR
jgi:hypothetical protein